jgi:hypothetical protein
MKSGAKLPRIATEAELLILPDGRVLVHNLTSMMAEALLALNPEDQFIHRRIFARRKGHSTAATKPHSRKPKRRP